MPLEAWVCDTCGELATSDDNSGMVVWQTHDTDGRFDYYDFKIVHKTIASDPHPYRCDPGAENGFTSSLPLNAFLGADGLALLLSWLSQGPLKSGGTEPRVVDMDQFVDLVRRVQTPYYEEARSRFDDERTHYWLGDANEYAPYRPDTLRRIADGTLDDD